MQFDLSILIMVCRFQDPLDPNDTLIVIRSLVPGGVAQLDGSLIPGDRLLFVNDINLENSSLDQAVQALKGAPKGVVRIGVAKPLPMADAVNLSSSYAPTTEQLPANNVAGCQHSGYTPNNKTPTTTDPDIIPERKSK